VAHDAIARSTGKGWLTSHDWAVEVKDDTMLHRSWRSGDFTMEKSVVVDFKYALISRDHRLGSIKQAMDEGAAAMIKEQSS